MQNVDQPGGILGNNVYKADFLCFEVMDIRNGLAGSLEKQTISLTKVKE